MVRELRVNSGIRAKEVRLVGEQGEQLGIMPLLQAQEAARTHNLDLVEVAPNVVPVVCRLLDYGKYRYEQTKKEREARRGQRVSLLRQVRLHPKISDHDFETKVTMAKKLLDGGDKVRVGMFFRGREISHPEIGRRLLQRMVESLKEVASVEGQPLTLGRRMDVILLPLASEKAKKTKEEAKKS